MASSDRGPHDPRRRRGVPDRLLLPPAPREPELAERWRRLPFERRRALGHASVRADRQEAAATPTDRELVRALARARVASGWRLQAAALVLGWLVLMTLWGFGRTMGEAQEGAWLAAGLLAGGLVWLGAALAAARRVRRAREVADDDRGDGRDDAPG